MMVPVMLGLDSKMSVSPHSDTKTTSQCGLPVIAYILKNGSRSLLKVRQKLTTRQVRPPFGAPPTTQTTRAKRRNHLHLRFQYVQKRKKKKSGAIKIRSAVSRTNIFYSAVQRIYHIKTIILNYSLFKSQRSKCLNVKDNNYKINKVDDHECNTSFKKIEFD